MEKDKKYMVHGRHLVVCCGPYDDSTQYLVEFVQDPEGHGLNLPSDHSVLVRNNWSNRYTGKYWIVDSTISKPYHHFGVKYIKKHKLVDYGGR